MSLAVFSEMDPVIEDLVACSLDHLSQFAEHWRGLYCNEQEPMPSNLP